MAQVSFNDACSSPAPPFPRVSQLLALASVFRVGLKEELLPQLLKKKKKFPLIGLHGDLPCGVVPPTRHPLRRSQSLSGPEPFQEPFLDQNHLVKEGPEGQATGAAAQHFCPR